MNPNGGSASTFWENPNSFQSKGRWYYCHNGKLADTSDDDDGIFLENSSWETKDKEIRREKSVSKVPTRKKGNTIDCPSRIKLIKITA